MADLPASLKIPEISRFINRANQLRNIKPAIAYWCEYHAVNQIVSRNLHTTDEDGFAYTRTLIERLETTKAARADDDAIADNDAGRASVEVFADETFARAERTLRANRVTRQTADTFDAAATFFEVTSEWGPLDAETTQKIKFAKWNAARILRAIREGTDPNESNPKSSEPAPSSPNSAHTTNPARPPPVSVEDVPEDAEPPSGLGLVPTSLPTAPAAVAPTPDSNQALNARTMSQNMEPPPAPESPRQFATQIPLQPSPFIPTKIPRQFQPSPEVSPDISMSPAPSLGPSPAPHHPPAPPPVAPPPAAPVHAPPAPVAVNPNSIGQAQKHAKWAISALNFDDVPTAVNELRSALAVLGAQ